MYLLTGRVPLPRFVWIAVALEGWLEGTIFGNFFVPGLYLFAVNGIGMLVLAALTVLRRPIAPWLTGALGIGLMIWIAVQLLLISQTMFLQPLFFVVGVALGFIALFWLIDLRRVGALRLA